MSSFFISWNPVNNSNSTGQIVQYKQRSASSWTNYETVVPQADSILVTGLSADVLYDFRVENLCIGNNQYTNVQSAISSTCPTVNTSAGETNIQFTFTSPTSASYTQIEVDLYLNGNIVQRQMFQSPFGTNTTGNFTGLQTSNLYEIGVIYYASEVTTSCPLTAPIIPTCILVTGITGSTSV